MHGLRTAGKRTEAEWAAKALGVVVTEERKDTENAVKPYTGVEAVALMVDASMIDGKTAHILADTASNATCEICQALPSEMNNFAILSKKSVNQAAVKRLLSVLHAWIRCFEYLWHVARNKPIKRWRRNC